MNHTNQVSAVNVPPYALDVFSRVYAHTDLQKAAVQESIKRSYRLIAHALRDMPPPRNAWAIRNTKLGNSEDIDFGYEEDGVRAYIYGQERGSQWLEAVFTSTTSGAEYFVWRISNGTRKIDWDLQVN